MPPPPPRPSATKLQEASEHMERLCLDISREVLRSPDVDLFHDDQRALYTFLADYFDKMADRFRHEDSIAITKSDAAFVLRDIYGQAKMTDTALQERRALTAIQGEINELKLDELYESIAVSQSGPFVSQRAIREQLQGSKINVAALSEVLELCRLLDTKFAVTVPFGQVNVTHFAAVFCTLLPCDSLIELIDVVFDALPPTRASATGPNGRPGSARGTPSYRAADLQKIRLFHCWATLDDVNRGPLRELGMCILRRPNITLPLVLDAMPSLKLVHSVGFERALAGEQVAGKVAVYGDSDDAAVPTSSSAQGVVASYDADDDGTQGIMRGEDEEKEDGDSDDMGSDEGPVEGAAGGGGAFWSALVADAPA